MKTLDEIKQRLEVILADNPDYKDIFKSLKTEMIVAYVKNDFRVSVLKDFASRLVAIIELISKNA